MSMIRMIAEIIWRVIKVVFKVVLAAVILAVILLVILSFRDSAPRNYTRKTETGGEIEAAYLADGSYHAKKKGYEAEDKDQKKYTVYYPAELEESDRAYPVIIMVNGTGVKASKYEAVLKHYASWGFIAAGNEHPSSGTGLSTDMTYEFLVSANENDPLLGGHVDLERIGIEGHSQGGAGVLTELSVSTYKEMIRTGIALSPTHEETAHAYGWMYDLSEIDVPVLMMAGTESEFETQLVIPLEAMKAMYEKIPADKAMMRRIGADHGKMLYTADGYATAWMMWQLQGDEYAAKAFTGADPEILRNDLYTDQKMSIE